MNETVQYDFSNMPEGLVNLTDGYIDYAKEVIVNRALPDLRDGLKPVNRRIMYTYYNTTKRNEKVKSANVVGSTMKLHPHGDNSIYQSMVLMVDTNKSMGVPVFEGQGNFGSVYTNTQFAASRYTEVKFMQETEEYFGEMNGVNFVDNYDGTTEEPTLLPVSYPAVLCNSSSGIAVGFRSNIPSFNFNEVIDLTREYIRDGVCSTVLCPDFSTGGYYIRNNKELDKLMKTGLASLKLRGKLTYVDREINIVEYPYGKTIQGLLGQINKANISGVRDAGDIDDYEHGAGLLVNCTGKNRVNEVILNLYRVTDLQCNFPADMMVTLNDKPIRLGVWGIVEEWVKWRKQVLTKEFTIALEQLKADLVNPLAFIHIIKDRDKCKEIVRLTSEVSDKEAIKYILDNYTREEVSEVSASWIISRRLNEFRTGGKYAEKVEKLQKSMEMYEKYLSNLDAYIISQLDSLQAKYGSKYPRQTEVTLTDYEFKVSEQEAYKDDTPCMYQLKNGFLKKLRQGDEDKEAEYSFIASASETLIAVDNRGRVLRVYCEDLPYTGNTELGVYLPRYFELDEMDDYKIYWIGVLDGSTKIIVYKDGNVGFLDTNEWLGVSRKVRVIEKGIATSAAHNVGYIADIPEALCVVDSDGRLGLAYTTNIKHKERTAKTRVFNLNKGNVLSKYIPMKSIDVLNRIANSSRYLAPKLAYLETMESLDTNGLEYYLMYN